MRKIFQQGFTLLELLVVISIIAILVGLSAVSYTTAQKKARDSRRLGDMKAMAAVYEQYYSDPANSYQYPAAGCSNSDISTYAPAGWPIDPKNSAPYTYTKTCSSTAYCFCAKLEGASGGNSSSAATDCTGLGGATTDYFCVKNQQ